ncbi:AarF/ABC1/UbiB kinase family protein [candidate division WOR-3 bacterium]|nr:AarF/ABC1/UbiB kinase family protein [candidate division WOR-3 bacterium]
MFYWKIGKSIRNLKRLRQILLVFAKYGFRDIIDRLPIKIPYKIKKLLVKGSRAENLRKAIEELGPTFIKFGQLLSVRADIFPQDFIHELSILQDEVVSLPFETIKKVIEEELNSPIDKLFSSFDRKPIASASLAQVHTAITKEGSRVVVKVQRPNIKSIIDTDISIMELLAGWIEKEIRETREYELLFKVKEIGKNLRSELNFTNEGKAVDRFRTNFSNDESILIPKVYWNLCTSKVLTLQHVEGIKITDIDTLESVGLSRNDLAERGVDFIFKQIFVHGYFHADPHPGNILVTKDGKIALLDFGLTGSLDEELVESLSRLLISVVNKDVNQVMNIFTELGVVSEDMDMRELKYDLREFVERYYGVRLARIEVRSIADDALEIFRKYRMKFPRDLILLAKALSTVEGIAYQLDPKFDIIEHIKPYVKQLIERRYDPKRLLKVATELLTAYTILFRNLPDNLTQILRKLRKGKLKVEFEHKGLENIISQIERSTNRLSFSLIITALIIGSSLIIQTKRGLLLFGFPVLGIVGFVIAGTLGIFLIITMLRSRNI